MPINDTTDDRLMGGGEYALSYSLAEFVNFVCLGLFDGGGGGGGILSACLIHLMILSPWIIRWGNLSPLDYSLFVVVVVSLGFSLGDLFCLGLFAGGFYLPWFIRRGICLPSIIRLAG